MKLTILGGGGFRVPLVHGAVLADQSCHVDEIVLHDTSSTRLKVMTAVLREQAAGHRDAPRLTSTTRLEEALEGADFVFSAIRVSGLEGRCCDERIGLDHGVLGQETTGAGGLVYGLRTLPAAMTIARTVAQVCPQAWVINFTNPAGMVTQAMQQVLGPRVVGICDSPIGLGRRAARALGLDPERTQFRYSGLNHLGWLHQLISDGRDVLPDLLADPTRLAGIEEGRLFGADWLASLGSLPNEYLHYYYFNRDAVAAITSADQTRGEYLRRTQTAFYRDAAASDHPLQVWHEVHHSRDASYMAEARAEGEERDPQDVEGGGYERVAVAIMKAISTNEVASIILNVRNNGALAGLPDEAVVEVPCTVNAAGPQPLAPHPLRGHQLGLAATVKECEMLVIEAVAHRDPDLAVKAVALHPLVDSVTVARDVVRDQRRRNRQVDAVFG